MSFFFAFCAAGFLGLGFAALAFRYARALCLHVLVFWIYFVAAPFATAWLYTGEITSRALIGQDLYSSALADALAAHAHLYVLYGLGVLFVAILLRDRQIAGGVMRTLAAQRFNILWPIAFAAALLTEFLLKLSAGVLLTGSSTAERVADMPYIVSSLLAVLGSVTFGLFCYLCVLSARAKPLLVVCLAYLPYVLATDGRRAMTMVLVTLFVLRGLSVGFRPNWRLVGIAKRRACALHPGRPDLHEGAGDFREPARGGPAAHRRAHRGRQPVGRSLHARREWVRRGRGQRGAAR